MADIFKFPHGYDVRVLRKEDVVKTIDENIVDKEIALAIIKRLEIDAAAFMNEGRWTGIPHLGSMRIRMFKKLEQTDVHKELVKEAREQLDNRQYVLFRKDLAGEYKKQERAERYFKYIVSKQANKNKNLYRELAKKFGENYAQLFLYLTAKFTPVGDIKVRHYGNY